MEHRQTHPLSARADLASALNPLSHELAEHATRPHAREPDRREIAECAYHLWKEHGGDADSNWYSAEQACRTRAQSHDRAKERP